MKIVNQIYYHFQRINEKNKHWKKGDIIEFTKAQENYYFSSLKNCISSFQDSITEINVKNKIASIEELIKSETVKQTENPELIYQMKIDSVNEQLDEIRNYYNKCIQLQQEIIFEAIRKRIDIQLPSRHSCIWVTENINELCQWYETLKCQKSKILKLNLNGNIHNTSGIYIDIKKNRNVKNAILSAKKYWNGDFDEEKEIEYLFEGKIEIIEIL